MTEAETILQLIETVDPTDTAKLNEIDARVWCYLVKDSADKMVYVLNENGQIVSERLMEPVWKVYGLISSRRYSHSRDALKAIRPDGLFMTITIHHEHGENVGASVYADRCLSMSSIVRTKVLPTEELAELHAIIQAIDYERRSSKDNTN